ncbi:MAG TPA: hypothetical protein VEI97_01240 [bacterium]|nr:hypothetical protein [bacterium]
MPLPDLSDVVTLCTQDPRCHGLIALGPAVHDIAAPQAGLVLLLVADHGEEEGINGAATEVLPPVTPSGPPVELRLVSPARFAERCADPCDPELFLDLAESAVLYDPAGAISALREEARAWTPLRMARATLRRTGELAHALDRAEHALAESHLPEATGALYAALIALRRLEYLEGQAFPGEGFWTEGPPSPLAGAAFQALLTPSADDPSALRAIAADLADALDAALDRTLPYFAEALAAAPEGIWIEEFRYLPEFEGIENTDLLLWRHRGRGELVVTGEQSPLPEEPGVLVTRIRVKLP